MSIRDHVVQVVNGQTEDRLCELPVGAYGVITHDTGLEAHECLRVGRVVLCAFNNEIVSLHNPVHTWDRDTLPERFQVRRLRAGDAIHIIVGDVGERE